MPAGGAGDAEALRLIEERIAEVAATSGWQIGTDDPNAEDAVVAPRYPQDRYLETESLTLYYWRSTTDAEAGAWVPVVKATTERTIGIESPVEGNVYPIMAVADARYLLVDMYVVNITATGGTAEGGMATVLVNGVDAVLGETIIESGDFVGLRVDAVGEGTLSASVYARLA
jgi:hypothetical protein